MFTARGVAPRKGLRATPTPFRSNRGARPCLLMALDRRGLGADFDGLKCRGLRAWIMASARARGAGCRFERTAGGVATARKESADVGRHRQAWEARGRSKHDVLACG